MSYNMTGADRIKCKWICEVAEDQDVNYVALQEHFKTVKSTEQWFRVQFKDYSRHTDFLALMLVGGEVAWHSSVSGARL